jgi:hypothetical protein
LLGDGGAVFLYGLLVEAQRGDAVIVDVGQNLGVYFGVHWVGEGGKSGLRDGKFFGSSDFQRDDI